MHDELIGQRCGDSYVISAMLGAGGMGAVYLATSEALAGQQAAVKVLLPELTRRPETLARFRAEAYAAGKIKDENIVKIFDTGELPGGRHYMLMEYCSGGSLAGLLAKRGPLPFELILTTLAPIGSALDTAHTEAKITHRDIKPENILLDRVGSLLRAKLGDFGIVKLHDQAGFMMTGTKKILGSPGYMAPEQCAGKGGVDSRADIYAFGCVLYETVTGRRPYAGDSLFELIQQVVTNAPFPRPSELRADLPPAWEAVILGCLAHRREDRIQSIKEVIEHLARAIPNGASLVSFFAPRLVENRRAPSAATLSDGIGPAATLWSDAHAQSVLADRRHRAGARMLVGLLTGLVVGSAATALALHGRAGSPAAESNRAALNPAAPVDGGAGEPVDSAAPRLEASPAPVEVQRVATVATDAGVDAPRLAAAPVDVAIDAPRIAVADAAIDAPRIAVGPADAAIDAPRGLVVPSAGASLAAHDPVKPDKPPRPAEKRPAPVRLGTLRVEVDPWADVEVIGQKVGRTTPVTLSLPAGHYRVVLRKGEQKETVDVTIKPNETTRLLRSW